MNQKTLNEHLCNLRNFSYAVEEHNETVQSDDLASKTTKKNTQKAFQTLIDCIDTLYSCGFCG